MRNILKTLVLLSCPLLVLGQDMAAAREIITKINQAYANMPNFRTNVAYHLYKDHTSNDIVDSDSAVIVRAGNSTWFEMGQVETLSDDQYELMVHHEDKVIVVSGRQAAATDRLPHLALDSLLALCDHSELGVFGEVGCLYLSFPGSEATGVSICYRLSDFQLYALTTYYRYERTIGPTEDSPKIKPRLEIRYLYTDTNLQMDRKKLKYSWFVHKSGKDFKPTTNFKNYKIYNQVIEN